MSFSQFLKDYIDAINNFCDSLSGDINILSIIQFTLFYLGQSIKLLIQYILTLQWFIDFCSLKITIPQLINSNFLEAYSLENPLSRFFSFFDTPPLTLYPFFSGVVNSFFLSLPFSANYIIWLRCLTIGGIPAGIIGGLGIITGQCFLISCILLGFRFLIFPWLSFELFHYVLGIILTVGAAYRIGISRSLMRIKVTETLRLRNIFLFHFCLTWTEQSTLFQYFSNISFTPEPTLFEVLNWEDMTESYIEHISYIVGLLIGSILWMTIIGALFVWMGYAISTWFNFRYSRWVRGVHKSVVVLLFAFAFTSLPYYNMDYLVTSPFGFISGDDALKGFQLRTNYPDFRKGRLGDYSSHTSLDTDTAPYDRGRYVSSSEVELTFEDLNYQGEYSWRSRNDRIAYASMGKRNRFLYKVLAKYREWARGEWVKLRRVPPVPQVYDAYKDEGFFKREYTAFLKINPFFQRLPDLTQRFLNDYQQADVAFMGADDEDEFSAFGELVKYGFDSFGGYADTESDEYEEALGRRIKAKYYNNYVYKNILNTDFYAFLGRQPKSHSLKAEEENTLFQKRVILANYYDNLREYKKLPYYRRFRELFLGPKSYANRVYNQQFKGTLKILRRLFAISLVPPEDSEQPWNVLKPGPRKPWSIVRAEPKQQLWSVLKFDQPLYKEKNSEKNPILHEELKNSYPSLKRGKMKPFLRETDPMPFYAGWDEQSRKFLITNYILPHADSSVETNYFTRIESEGNNKSKTIHFLTWPIPKSEIENPTYPPTKSLNLMYTSFDDPANEDQMDVFEYDESDDIRLIYETLPTLVKRVDLRDFEKIKVNVKPLRGGWLWPGGEPLRLEVKNALFEFKSKIDALRPQFLRGWRDSNP